MIFHTDDTEVTYIQTLQSSNSIHIYITTSRPSTQHVPSTRYRQPNCTAHKLANSNNRNSSRRATLVNSAETWGKNRCHTGPIISSKIVSQPTRPPIWTMLRDLWGKSQIRANRNWKSIKKSIY